MMALKQELSHFVSYSDSWFETGLWTPAGTFPCCFLHLSCHLNVLCGKHQRVSSTWENMQLSGQD